MGFEMLEHTGDVAVRLCAPDLPGLIEAGIEALRSLIFAGTPPRDAEELRGEAQVSGVDREDVLVQALSEALHLMQGQGLFPREIQVESAGQDEARIMLLGVLVDGRALQQVEEIKAVTYHAVEIRGSGGELETTVVFDV